MSEVETRKRHSLNNGYAEVSLMLYFPVSYCLFLVLPFKLSWLVSQKNFPGVVLLKMFLWLTSKKHGYHVTFYIKQFWIQKLLCNTHEYYILATSRIRMISS